MSYRNYEVVISNGLDDTTRSLFFQVNRADYKMNKVSEIIKHVKLSEFSHETISVVREISPRVLKSPDFVNPIIEATAFFRGDPSVGINSWYYSLEFDREALQDKECREWVRTQIEATYKELDDFKCHISFDDEGEEE